jgi:hypothetical protein
MGRWETSGGESYVELEPERTFLGGGACQELAESCDRRREWLERGDLGRDELEPGLAILKACREDDDVDV